MMVLKQNHKYFIQFCIFNKSFRYDFKDKFKYNILIFFILITITSPI